MTVKKAIELLSQMPPEATLVVASLGHGGDVPVQGFSFNQNSETFIDVEFCEDEEVKNWYGHAKIV